MKKIEREIVAAIIISKDKKILMGKKYAGGGGVYLDCWHIPGGGVEEESDLKTAIIREILEETGINIADCNIELFDDQGFGESEKTIKETGEKMLCKMHFNVFKIKLDQNADDITLSLDDDLEEVRWLSLGDIKKVKLTPPSIELFSRIQINKLIE